MGHKSLDQLQAGTIDMFMIPGLIHLLLILTIIHDSYGGGTTVTGKVIYQGYQQLFGCFFFKLHKVVLTLHWPENYIFVIFHTSETP